MNLNRMLEAKFEPSVFGFEFLSIFTLVFFVFFWRLIARLAKKENNKLFLATGYTLAASLMFFLPWAASYYISNQRAMPLSNPLFTILQAVLQGYGFIGKEFTEGHIIASGLPYIIGGQLLGGCFGFIVFYGIFWMCKQYFHNHSSYGEIIRNLKLPHFFKRKDDVNIRAYAIKESIFILFFVITVPYIVYIDDTFYGTNQFLKHIVALVVIWIILYASSFFGFFAFHIIFPIIEMFLTTIAWLDGKANPQKYQREEYKNDLISTKIYLINLTKFIIVFALTIIIPILVGYITLLIGNAAKISLRF